MSYYLLRKTIALTVILISGTFLPASFAAAQTDSFDTVLVGMLPELFDDSDLLNVGKMSDSEFSDTLSVLAQTGSGTEEEKDEFFGNLSTFAAAPINSGKRRSEEREDGGYTKRAKVVEENSLKTISEKPRPKLSLRIAGNPIAPLRAEFVYAVDTKDTTGVMGNPKSSFVFSSLALLGLSRRCSSSSGKSSRYYPLEYQKGIETFFNLAIHAYRQDFVKKHPATCSSNISINTMHSCFSNLKKEDTKIFTRFQTCRESLLETYPNSKDSATIVSTAIALDRDFLTRIQ